MLHFKQAVYKAIYDTIGTLQPEKGGVFALDGDTVTDFYFDKDAADDRHFYAPTTAAVSRAVNNWLAQGKALGGYIHSHNIPYSTLSYMDLRAAGANLCLNNLDWIYMGVLCGQGLYLYKVIRQEEGPPVVESVAFDII